MWFLIFLHYCMNKFPVAKLMLSFPDLNAREERLFSMVKWNKTASVLNCDPQENLGNILTLRLKFIRWIHLTI